MWGKSSGRRADVCDICMLISVNDTVGSRGAVTWVIILLCVSHTKLRVNILTLFSLGSHSCVHFGLFPISYSDICSEVPFRGEMLSLFFWALPQSTFGL